MSGEGDFTIVAKMDGPGWMVISEQVPAGWGQFGSERRFPTQEDADVRLEGARRDAQTRLGISKSCVWVAYAPLQQIVSGGAVYSGEKSISVDFRIGDLGSGQMDLLGIF